MGVAVDRPAPAFRAAYDRLAARPAWTVCALFVVGSALSTLFDVAVGPTVRYLPLAASVVVFGLPHGAVDYLVPARIDGRPLARSMATVGAVYLVLGGAYTALWLLAPVPAAAFFIAMTWFHWGQGDVHALVAFVGVEHLPSRTLRAATGFVRGGLPMFVPLVAFPERYRAVVAAWTGLFGAEFSATWLFSPRVRLLGGGLFLAVTLATLAAGYRHDRGGHGWRVDAGETALLWVFFLTVPPLVAVGVYFCIWHALRHVLRVVAADGNRVASPDASGALDALGPLRQFAREAAPLTALALILLVGFGLLVPATPSTPEELTAVYLVFVAVLTLPHVVVVTWMDRREGVWVG